MRTLRGLQRGCSHIGTICVLGVLAACGGSGGSGSNGGAPVGGAPAPSATPSPSPSPPAPAAASPTPTPLTGAAAIAHAGNFSVLGYAVTGSTDARGVGTTIQQADGVEFRQVSSSGAFELKIPSHDWGTLGNATTQGGNVSRQEVTVGSGPDAFTYDLALFIPGTRNRLLSLVYTSYGSWVASAPQPGDPNRIDQNFGSFAYGVATPPGGVPLSGTVTFQGVVFDAYDTPGRFDATIDFASWRVSGFVEPLFNDGIGGIGGIGGWASSARVPFEGLLGPDRSTFAIQFGVGATGQSGLIEGQFAGPSAEELMFRWNAAIIVPHLSAQPRDTILLALARRS